MKVVGLTGGIGSGKSTVARMLADRGAEIVDADAIARDVVRQGTATFETIVAAFGDDVVGPDGDLDRKRLAAIAFASEDARRQLEAMTHPAIETRMLGAIDAASERDNVPFVVVDHPLLIETGRYADFDVLVVVIAPESVRIDRVVAGRAMDADDVGARMAAQTDDATRRRLANHVIDNDADLDALQRRADEVYDLLTG